MKKLTTEEFIRKARLKHGDKYDYSKVVYINAIEKICIICRIHGEFWQRAGSHLQNGCRKCGEIVSGDKHRITTEEFLARAEAVHGDRYIYTKSEYRVDGETKVCIICRVHGEFWQTPNNHLKGAGCRLCSNMDVAERCRETTEGFIVKAEEIHGPRYIYTETKYGESNLDPVCIICREHGEFLQTPLTHLKGCGCPRCGFSTISDKKLSNLDEFLRKSQEIHGERYIYTDSVYTGSLDPIHIICREHGSFRQVVYSHLRGNGCPSCGDLKKTKSHSQFLEEANETHKNKYIYPEEYRNIKTKIKIVCPEHGEFTQVAQSHLSGSGCPSCAGNDPKWQREVQRFIKSIYPGIILYNDRTTIKYSNSKRFLELDLYLPEIKIAFECQGKYFHDEDHFPGVSQRDQEKAILCKETGIVLLPIWEHEWMDLVSQVLIKDQIKDTINNKIRTEFFQK